MPCPPSAGTWSVESPNMFIGAAATHAGSTQSRGQWGTFVLLFHRRWWIFHLESIIISRCKFICRHREIVTSDPAFVFNDLLCFSQTEKLLQSIYRPMASSRARRHKI